MGATIDRSVNSGGGPNVFKICGAVCPRIGSLLPEEGETPKYAELYIYHGGDEADNRIQALNKDDKAEGGLDKDIVKGLEIMLNTHNSLVKQFRMAKQVLAENEFADVSIRIVAPGELDGPQFNLPSTDELACLVFGEVTLEAPKRDIIIRCRGSGLQRISSLHPAYMSLQYPLLFPYVLHTVEFQKRGLPHAHILVWQDKEKRGEVTPALIDSFVSAEIPDPVEDPLGYALVAEFMMHGPCGEHNPKCPCMKDGAHLNVEWCNKTHVIKYLYKYVTKGPDFSKTLFERIKNTGDPEDDDIDEIEEYRTCRYICANDSFWRCYGFDIHSKHPSVERLVVHLLGKHVVRFRALANLPALVNNSLLQKTMVTEWFVANARHASARSLTYYDFPTRWSWVAESKKWVRRKRSDKIGRVYYVHPSTGELYYLRMLLMLVKGAKCYADVRTYNGTVYGSFKDACTARGLLGDDTEWYYAFDEALEWGIGNQLRQLFVTMILYCGVLDENVFFEKYWTYLAEDIQYRIRSSLHDASYTVPVDELRNMLLDELAVVFAKNGSSISNHALPLKTIYANDSIVNNMVSDELSQDCETLIKTAETMQQQLNEDQKVAFKTIVGKVRDGKPGLFFVSGQGGTGKTFLWNAMVAYLRGYKRIVLTVASSGVASLLLPGGRTAHSRFKIPIDLENDGVCDIRRGTMLCSLIEAASLIIWDEALMTHRKCFEALDRSLRDVLSADDPLLAELPFGGKVVVLGGDLRQILPVIEGGTRSQVVDAAITNSPLWGHIIVLPLTINQRLAVQTANAVVQAEVAAFAEWVLNIGDGTIPAVARQGESSPTWITIPDEYLVHTEGDKIAAIVESVYIDLLTRYSDPNYLKERAILTPTNDIAEDINKHVLSMVPQREMPLMEFMAVNLLSEIHSRSNQWTISVLISLMWHYRGGTDEGPLQHTDVVLIDQEGNHMYGELPPATSERLKDVLEEGNVFIIRKFMCNESKTSFRPVESPFMVQFTRYTTVQEMPALVDTYPFCTYSLTSFADIPAAVSHPARFVDVIGKIQVVSDIVPVQSIYQTTPSNTRTIILKDQLGNELRLVLWGERALEFDAEAVRAMGVNEPVIAIFVGTLPKMSHGVKSLSGGSACRWYIDEDIPDINLFRERSSTPKRGARRSLFTSPSKDKSQLGEDDPLAADGDLLLGEETITEPLVETASANAIAVDSDKANQTVIPKTKRNASSTKSDVTSEELLGPLSAAMLRHTIDESCFGPVTYSSDEAHFPAPHLVKISCKMMFGVMLADLGLPNARYSSYVHEDGEVSSVVTFYSPSRFVGEGLEQFKIGGSLAATSEIVEDSAAREGIRHIEESEDVKIEDLHYAELTSVMKSYKKLLWKSMKKRKESENFEKQLSASIKRMAGSSRNIVSLISDRRSVGQGSEAVYYNETLARIEAVANELSEVAKEIKKEAKEA
ncbi:hypothetical protein ACQ4PT_063881 [Festuca glaucescens]